MTEKAHNLTELTEGAAWCRGFGHSWAKHGQTPRVRGWTITLACTSCGTLKLFQFSQRGELTTPRYVYPPRYLAGFFIGADERAALRKEALGLTEEETHGTRRAGSAAPAAGGPRSRTVARRARPADRRPA